MAQMWVVSKDGGVGTAVGAGVGVGATGFLYRLNPGAELGVHAASSAADHGPDRHAPPAIQPHPLASPQKWSVIAAQSP